MQEIQVWSLGQEDTLEEGMAVHSSIVTWKIPWREVPGGLQSMELQRAGHNWVHTSPYIFTFGLFRVIYPRKSSVQVLSYLSRRGIVLIRIICPKPESSIKCMIRKKKKKLMFIYLWNVFMTLLCTLICRGQKGKELLRQLKFKFLHQRINEEINNKRSLGKITLIHL